MNQGILSPNVIRQDFGETTLNRVRKEMEMSFVARSAREGLKAPGDPDRPNEQTSLGIEDERLSKSKTVTPNVKVADRRHARWLFHYEQEQDKPAQRRNLIVRPKRTNKRRGE